MSRALVEGVPHEEEVVGHHDSERPEEGQDYYANRVDISEKPKVPPKIFGLPLVGVEEIVARHLYIGEDQNEDCGSKEHASDDKHGPSFAPVGELGTEDARGLECVDQSRT